MLCCPQEGQKLAAEAAPTEPLTTAFLARPCEALSRRVMGITSPLGVRHVDQIAQPAGCVLADGRVARDADARRRADSVHAARRRAAGFPAPDAQRFPRQPATLAAVEPPPAQARSQRP